MLYFNEHVSHRLADALQGEGIDVTTVNLLGHKGESDAIQLLRAAELGRIVVTHNVNDFILLHEAWLARPDAWDARRRIEHAGILTIHPVKSPSVEVLTPEIVGVIRSAGPLLNRLLSWDRRYGWREYREQKLHPVQVSPGPGDGPA